MKEGIVLSNEREIRKVGKVTYMPICFVMFLRPTDEQQESELLL